MSKQSKRRHRAKMLQAASETQETIMLGGTLTIEAAVGDGQKGPRRYEMLAYGGGELQVAGFPLPIVVDLQGMSFRSDKLPTYFGHHDGSDGSKLVGHSDRHDTSDGRLVVAGAISSSNQFASEVLAAHDNGFEWQASIGVIPDRTSIKEIKAGLTVQINNRQFTGPILVAGKSVLRHIAILPEGADSGTSLSIAANVADKNKELDMKFTKWLETLKLDPETLDDQQTALLQAKFDAEVEANKALIPDGLKVSGVIAGASVPEYNLSDVVLAYETHIATVQASAATYADKIDGAKLTEIQAKAGAKAAELKLKALNDKKPAIWLEAQLIKAQAAAEVELIRAERPKPPIIHGSRHDVNDEVIQAAFSRTAGLPDIEKHYTAEVLEASNKLRGFGLQELLLNAAAQNGYTGRAMVNNGTIKDILQAAFSTHTVTTMLTQLGHKTLLSGFNSIPQTWREVATTDTVSDFKTVTAYRMTASLEYEKLAPAGEIAHGTLGQESYTKKADTYAKMLVMTRTDIINDDLGAFNDILNRLGIVAALKVNNVLCEGCGACVATCPSGAVQQVNITDKQIYRMVEAILEK